MITSDRRFTGHLFNRVVRGSSIACSIASIWFVGMASVMLFTDVAPAALVIMPNQKLLNSMPLQTKLLRSGEHVMVVTSTEPNHALSLYKAGAWLVLPALKNGCFDISKVRKARR